MNPLGTFSAVIHSNADVVLPPIGPVELDATGETVPIAGGCIAHFKDNACGRLTALEKHQFSLAQAGKSEDDFVIMNLVAERSLQYAREPYRFAHPRTRR